MTSTCSVTMNQAKNVTAEFEKDGLEVTINAPRYGLVASLSPLILCGRFFGKDATLCSAQVKPGDSIHFRDMALTIDGPLFTNDEKDKIAQAVKAGGRRFYLSYAEKISDVAEFRELIGPDEIGRAHV